MKYYIFAGNSSNIKCNKRQALFQSRSLSEAIEKFAVLSKDINFVSKYQYAYLICHLGMPGVSGGSKSNPLLRVNIKNKTVPFLIVQKYYFDNKPVVEDVCNSITIDTDGFREEFCNNKYAVEKFGQYYNKLEASKMILNFVDDKGQEDNVVIANTILMMKCKIGVIDANYTFDIQDVSWKNGEINDFDRISLSNVS